MVAAKWRGHVTAEHIYNVLYSRLLVSRFVYVSIHYLLVALYGIMISYTVNYCLVVLNSRF